MTSTTDKATFFKFELLDAKTNKVLRTFSTEDGGDTLVEFYKDTGIKFPVLTDHAKSGELLAVPGYGLVLVKQYESVSAGSAEDTAKPKLAVVVSNDPYTVYEFSSQDGAKRFFVDTSGDGKAVSPDEFTEKFGIPFAEVEAVANKNKLIDLGDEGKFLVESFEAGIPNPKDEAQADLIDALNAVHKLSEEDQQSIWATVEKRFGENPFDYSGGNSLH